MSRPRIFVSYRRKDQPDTARLIHEKLCDAFGADHVFMDTSDVEWGADFVETIERRLNDATVVVVVIGPHWRRILRERAQGEDWVRTEVSRALERQRQAPRLVRVIPVLVCRARVLSSTDLPDDLAALARRNMLPLRPDAFNQDMGELIGSINRKNPYEVVRDLWRDRQLRLWAVALGLLAFAAEWLGLFDLIALDTRARIWTMQLARALPGAAAPAWSGDVVVVGIDDRAEAAVKRPFGPSWRGEIATLIDRAAAAGARTLALDVTFTEPAHDRDDAALERALAAARGRLSVVVAVHDVEQGAPALLPRFQPYVGWGVACLGQRLGQAYVQPLALRRGPAERAVLWPSFALAAYTGGAPLGDSGQLDALGLALVVTRDGGGQVVVRGYGTERVRRDQPGCTAVQPGDLLLSQLLDSAAVPVLEAAPRRLSLADVLQGQPAALQALRGRTVLVGTMAGPEDRHGTPGGTRYGVELLATQVDGLLRGAAVRPVPVLVQALSAVALALAGTSLVIALQGARRRWAWPVASLIGGAYVLAGVLWYRSEQQLAGLPYGLLGLALGTGLAWRATRTGVKR